MVGFQPHAEAASQGPNSPGTAANDNSFGSDAWSNTDNAIASDDTVAHANTSLNSQYLKVTNFGFSIPDGATITGIEVDMEKYQLLLGGANCQDARVRLVKGGTVGTEDKSSANDWPSASNTVVSYGGASDLWGETWSASDINASNFGFVIATTATTDNCNGYVDYITITVHYTAGAVPEFSTWMMLITLLITGYLLHTHHLLPLPQWENE